MEHITKLIPKFVKISCILIVVRHKMLNFPFQTLEQHITFKESMINRLSNLINHNRSAAKISQVLCSNIQPPPAKSLQAERLATLNNSAGSPNCQPPP